MTDKTADRERSELRERAERAESEREALRRMDAEGAHAAGYAAGAAAERERWRSAAEYAAHQLEKARIWDGMEWHYNPLHPLHYRSALERLRDVLKA